MRLLPLTIEEIDRVTEEMVEDAKALKLELYKMCWYMRGSLSFTEAYQLDYENREIIAKVIDKNLETTKESGLPFF
jgi:hypothetical protein